MCFPSWLQACLPCCLHQRDESNPAHLPFNPRQGDPPPYSKDSPSNRPSALAHTQSCQVFSEWKKSGEASTNYTYEAWVLPETCLGGQAFNAQMRCLRHWLELQEIHESEVNVRCILRIPPSDSQNTELDVYNDMMAAKTLDMIYMSWDGRKKRPSVVASTQSNSLATIDDEIESIITESRNSDYEFKKLKDELLPLLVAKAAKSQEGWPLKEFWERKDEIMREEALFPFKKNIAVAAQFRLQAASAFQASDRQTSQAMYTLNFVPETVADNTYQAVRRFFAPADKVLRHNLQIRNKNGRSDSYCLQLVSFGADDKSEGGAQWQKWDDAHSGDEDRTDHTFINAKRLISEDPGPKLAEQLFLAAASSQLDRASSKKSTEAGLYGDGTGLDIANWKNCPACQNSEAV